MTERSVTRASSAATMAVAFSAQMSGQMPGWPAATRVMSRKPPAASRSSAPSCSAPSVAAFISVAATRCGTCDTTATRRSWSAADRTSTSAPRLTTTPLSRLKASRSVVAVGVSTHTAPTKSSGSAPVQAGLLRPGHRMAADEPRMVGLLHDRRLDPAHVRHDGIGPSARRAQDAAGHRGHRGGRDGHEDHLGLEVVAGRVDDAGVQGRLQPLRVGVETGDVPPAPAQPERDRPSDQPCPDDECPPAPSGLSRGGHRGALGRRGGRCA